MTVLMMTIQIFTTFQHINPQKNRKLIHLFLSIPTYQRLLNHLVFDSFCNKISFNIYMLLFCYFDYNLLSFIFLKKLILLAWSKQIDIEQWGFEDCITNAFLAPFNLLHLRVYVLLERWAQDCIDISWQLRASVLAQY